MAQNQRPYGMKYETESKQLLHIVLGGELARLDDVEFKDPSKIEIVGVYPSHAEAFTAWRSKAQQTVDNAHVRYFIVHLHRLLDPSATEQVAEKPHH